MAIQVTDTRFFKKNKICNELDAYDTIGEAGKSAKIGDHVLQDDGFKSLNHDIRSSVIFINFFLSKYLIFLFTESIIILSFLSFPLKMSISLFLRKQNYSP